MSSIVEFRNRVNQTVRKALSESKIAFSSAQRAQLDDLVTEITDQVLVEVDALMADMNRPIAPAPISSAALPPQPAAPTFPLTSAMTNAVDPADEQVLWEGRPFLSLGELYVVTSQRVRIITGLIGRDHEDIELIRIDDVDHTQNLGERILNIGDVSLRTADPSAHNVTLRDVTNPDQVHEIIRRAVLNIRRRSPFVFEQKM